MKQRTRRTLSRLLSLVLVLVMMLGMVNGTALAAGGNSDGVTKTNTSIAQESHKSDGDTSGKWQEALDKNDSGYIWADKSVQPQGTGDDSGFKITYSLMGKSSMESMEVPQPVDLVLVIDHSGSMGNAESAANEPNTRMRNMLKALNETIDAVMENPYSRVAVVMFHDSSTVLLPLDHYTRLPLDNQAAVALNGRSQDKLKSNASGFDYVQVLNHWENTRANGLPQFYYNLGGLARGEEKGLIQPVLRSGIDVNSNSLALGRTDNGKTDYLHGTQYFSSSGSTNIQAGLWRGMQVLIDAANGNGGKFSIPGADGTIQRKPALVLMTDGGATNILDGQPWALSTSSAPVGFSKFRKNPTYGINDLGRAGPDGNKKTVNLINYDYKTNLNESITFPAGEETTAILLATLMTAAYYKAQVKKAYSNTEFNVSAIAMDIGEDNPSSNTSVMEWLRSAILFHPNDRFKNGNWAHGSGSAVARDRTKSSFLATGFNGVGYQAIVEDGASDDDANDEAKKMSVRNARWNTWWADKARADYGDWVSNKSTFTYTYNYGNSDFNSCKYTIGQPNPGEPARSEINDNIYTWLQDGDGNNKPYYLKNGEEAVNEIKKVFENAYATKEKVRVPLHPIKTGTDVVYTDTIGAGIHLEGGIKMDARAFGGNDEIELEQTSIGVFTGPNRTVTNSYGQTANLSSITVSVSPASVSGKTTQTVTITIPEALVPVQIGNGGSTSPLKFSYSVKLNNDWKDFSETGDKYYSNNSASTSFTPSKDNHNYDTPNESWDTPKNTPEGETPVNPGGNPADDQEKNGGKVTVTHDNNGVLEVVVTVDLTIDKVAYHNSSDKLAGAEFKLTHNCTTNCGMTIADKVATYTAEETAYKFTEILAGHTYTLTETKAPDDYVKPEKPLATVTVEKNGKTTITATDAGKDLVNGSTVKNKLDPKPTSLTVKKEWQDGKTPPEGTEVTVAVYGQTGNDAKKFVQQLTLRSPKWSGTIENLPVIDVGTGANITYSVEEINIPDGYKDNPTISKADDGSNTFTITNVRDDEFKNITVQKNWEGYAPDYQNITIKANLFQWKDNVKQLYKENLVLNAANDWSQTFEVPVHEGTSYYTYTIEEASIVVNGVETPVADTPVIINGHSYTVSYEGTTITNTMTIPTTQISGIKTWKVGGEQHPDNITVAVTKTVNGQSTTNNFVVTPDAGGKWTIEQDFPQFDDQYNKITYAVKEVVPDGYSFDRGETENDFINTRTGTVDVTVSKVWQVPKNYFYTIGDDTQVIEYIPNVVVQLYRNEEPLQGADYTVTLSSPNQTHTWTSLPEYDEGGVKYRYTVREVNAEDGAIEIDGRHLAVKVSEDLNVSDNFEYSITNSADDKTVMKCRKSIVESHENTSLTARCFSAIR